jgi:phage baseplate assembly protein gpV
MSGMLPILQQVVAQELAGQRTCQLGVVTSTFPHESEDDKNNYEVNLQLKHEHLELRRVPVATTHLGAVAPPAVGDLVLVQFIDGDLNQPVVLGRFYDDESSPPLHKDGEVLWEHRGSDGKLNHVRLAADGSIFVQRDVTKPEDNSEAKATIRIDGASGNIEIKAGDGVFVLLKNGAEIQIKADGKPVKVDCDKLTVNGNVEVNGDLEVKGVAGGTKISGNTITGS